MSETEILPDLPEEQSNEPEKPQRRSVVAIVLGCLLIAFCLWVFAGMAALSWDPSYGHAALAAIFPGVPLLWIAFRQYRALFSCEPWQMRSFSGCFITMAVLAFLPLLLTVANLFRDTGEELRWIFGMMLIITIITMSLGIISVNNNRKRGLVGDSDLKLSFPFLDHYWKRDVIGLFVMGLIVAGIMAYTISEIPPQYKKNVPYEQMYLRSLFPENGRDFCYRRGGRSTLICEFTIDEQGFRDWIASDKKWEPCRPIQEDDWVDILPPSAYETGEREWGEGETPPKISDGLYASRGSHNGHRAAFDRATNRVYYWSFY